MPDEVVAAHLEHQLAITLDQRRSRLDTAADAELGEGLLPEAVDGGDRRFVEAVHGATQTRQPLGASVLAAPVGTGEGGHPHVVGRQRGPAEVIGRQSQRRPDAVAQLARRGPRERDDEQLVDAHRLLGEVAHHQPADRVGLAGAGARLDHRPAGRQRSGEIEHRHGGGRGHGAPCGAGAAALCGAGTAARNPSTARHSSSASSPGASAKPSSSAGESCCQTNAA